MPSCRFPECIEDNFLSQVVESSTQRDAILDLLVTNRRMITGDIKTEGSLGCSDHALVEFAFLRYIEKVRSIVRTLNFRKVKFQLFKELVNRTPWETALIAKGAKTELADL